MEISHLDQIETPLWLLFSTFSRLMFVQITGSGWDSSKITNGNSITNQYTTCKSIQLVIKRGNNYNLQQPSKISRFPSRTDNYNFGYKSQETYVVLYIRL